MYQIDEKIMADNRALISINSTKAGIDRLLKNGMINYVTNDHNDLYLTIPRSRDYGEYNRVVQEEADGKIPYDLIFKGSLTIEQNLTVLGTTTTIDTPNMVIEDNIIELNKNETGNGITLGSSGIQANRGTKGTANWLFSENTDVPGVGAFVFDVNGSIKTWIYEDGNVKTLNDFDTQRITAHNDIHGLTNLTIDQNSLLKGTLTVNGATSLTNVLTVTGATTLNNTLTTVGATWLKNTLRVDGASTLNNTLSVVGNYATTLGGTLTTTGATLLKNTLNVNGATDLDSTLNVDGAVTLQNILTTVGATWLKNTLRVDGATTLNSTLQVVDDAVFNDPVQMDETLHVIGAADFDSTMNVDGAATFQNTMTIKGLTTIDGNNLYVKYDAIRGGGQLTVDKHAEFNADVNIDSFATIGETLTVTGATALNNTLSVAAGATMNSTLSVVGATSLQSTLNVTGATTLNNTLTTVGAAQFNNTLTANGAGWFKSTMRIDGATTINNTLHTTGAVDFDSTLNVDGNVTIGGTLTTTGGTTLTGPVHLVRTLDVDGATNLNSTLNVVGNTTATTATFSGAVDMLDTLDVTGYTQLHDSLLVYKNLDVTLNTTLRGSLSVDLATLLKASLQVNGTSLFKNTVTMENAVSMLSTLGVTGATTLNDTLTVAKATNLNSTLSVVGNTGIGGTLGVTGATALANTLQVTGATTLKNTLNVQQGADFDSTVNVDGNFTGTTATMSGAVNLLSTLTVNGTSNFKNNVDIDTNLNVDGNTTIGGTLGVTGATSLANTLTVTGVTTLKDNVFIQKALDVTLASTLHNNLTVEGDTNLVKNGSGIGGKLTVGGVATFNDASTFNAAVTVNKPTTFNDNVAIVYKDLTLTKSTLGAGGNLTVDNHAEFNGIVNIDGNLTGTTATFSGAMTLQNLLTVSGLAAFKNNVSIDKDLTVTGNTTVSGITTLQNNLNVNGQLAVLLDTRLKSALAVDGSVTLYSALHTVGAADFDSVVNIDGAATINGALTQNALATFNNNMIVVGTTNLKSAVDIDSTLNVDGAVTLNNTLAVIGTSAFTGDVTMANDLTVTQAVWGKSTLTIDGAVTLNNLTTINGSTTINNTLTATGEIQSNTNFSLSTGDGKGYRFWDSDEYKIYMSSTTNLTYGARLDTTSDYNMVFKMTGGTNRGFVFENGTTELFQIAPDKIYSANDVYVYHNSAWTQLIRADQMGSGNGIDVDTVDGKHVDVDWAGTPNEIAMYNANNRVFDSDKLDGYHAGNANGNVPISNGTLNTNLNSDMLEGYHGAVAATANTYALRDASGDIKTAGKIYFNNFILKDVGGSLELRNAADNGWVDITINNLIVKGTTTTVNSETVTVADNIMLLNSNVTGAATENAGIQIERGTTGADASLLWDETIDKWKCGVVGSEIEISLLGHHHVKADIDDFPHKVSHSIGGNDFLSPADIGAVKNAGATPELKTALEADRPAAGMLGRLFFATDTKRIWQDMVTGWQIIGGQDTIPWTAVTGKPATYPPPIASSTVLGGVKIGSNIFLAEDGTISVATNPDTFLIERQEFITTAGQTVFTLADNFMMGRNGVSIYLFGQKLPNSAFTEIDNHTVQLKEAVDVGSLIEIEYMKVIDLYPYPTHAVEHLPSGIDPLPEATQTTPGWESAADKTKLDGISNNAKKVESSTTNGNIKIDGTETQVYRHLTYTHDQSAGSTIWTINHNLNRYPSVMVVDANGEQFMPKSIKYTSANQVVITFSVAEIGKAFLN